MELLEEKASMLSSSPLLCVHCLDLNGQTYIHSSNLACCRFLTVLGHVSFPKNLRERRLCLFVLSDKLREIENKSSPVVIKVRSSCIHKVSIKLCCSAAIYDIPVIFSFCFGFIAYDLPWINKVFVF